MKTKYATDTIDISAINSKDEGLKWKRILVPMDFSDSSARALKSAIPLARLSRGTLVLLHVVQLPPPTMPAPPATGGMGQIMDAHKAVMTEAKTRLEEIARTVGSSGIVVHQAVAAGVAWDEIVKAAKRLKADLVVMSTHGHTALMRVLASNTAEHVIRTASCPVLCVRG